MNYEKSPRTSSELFINTHIIDTIFLGKHADLVKAKDRLLKRRNTRRNIPKHEKKTTALVKRIWLWSLNSGFWVNIEEKVLLRTDE